MRIGLRGSGGGGGESMGWRRWLRDCGWREDWEWWGGQERRWVGWEGGMMSCTGGYHSLEDGCEEDVLAEVSSRPIPRCYLPDHRIPLPILHPNLYIVQLFEEVRPERLFRKAETARRLVTRQDLCLPTR